MELSIQDIRELLCNAGQIKATVKGSSQREIVVADRGWVVAGMVSEIDGTKVRIDNCVCIRVWGTTEGLGELAIKGPLKATKLDAMGDGIVIPNPILRIPCGPSSRGW